MYFVSQKPPKHAYLIGLHDHSIYAIGEEKRSGHLVIYRKNVLNAGEWDETIDINMTPANDFKCDYCEENKKSFACGIIDSKLWIMAAGKKIHETTEAGPHIFCVDLKSKEVINYKTQSHEMNEFLNQFCYECVTLQITYEDFDALVGKSRFMVQPNRLQSFPYYNSNLPTPLLWIPGFKQFYFTIDETNKTCEFGYFENEFLETKGMFKAGIVQNTLPFAFQILYYDGFEQDQFQGDYHTYALTNYIETEDLVYSRFYRNYKNELHCLIKEKFDDEGKGDGTSSFKLKIYKVDISVENETASFEFKYSFNVDANFPDIDGKCFVFATPNIISFTSENGEIVIVMNRMFSLSEIAYLALQKIPFSKKKSSWMGTFKTIFHAIQGVSNKDTKKSKNKFGVSLKYLKNYCGIPKNLEIKHGIDNRNL